MPDLFPAPKDKSECPSCQQLERAQGRCSNNCDCRERYWVYPVPCGNCGLGLIHAKYTGVPGHSALTCDSCDTPAWRGNSYIPTCPSTFLRCPDCPK